MIIHLQKQFNLSVPEQGETIRLNVWGRPFDIKVYYSLFEGETVMDHTVMLGAIRKFLSKSTKLISDCKSEVEKSIIEDSEGEVTKVDNIFKYIIPKNLYVHYDSQHPNDRLITIECNYKFDPSHGRCLLWTNEQFMGCVKDDPNS